MTTIVSPGFPDHYPSLTHKEWTVDVPKFYKVHIVVNVLSIERVWDTLTLIHIPLALPHDGIEFLLVSANVTSLILPSGSVVIEFCSDDRVEDNGFAFDFRLMPIRDGNNMSCEKIAEDTEFACSSGMQFVDIIARCDGKVDCHDVSDEVGCGSCPLNGYQCKGSDICLLMEFLCDGWSDCPLGDDEHNCSLQCPTGYTCGHSPYHIKYEPRHDCGPSDWLPFWVNASSAWRTDYGNITAKLATILNLREIYHETLEVGTFVDLPNLSLLDMTHCGLTHLTPGVFDGLVRLKKLILAHNKITFIEAWTFKGLSYLNYLYLESNAIHEFSEGCFKGLVRIKSIDLENNTISHVRAGAFKDVGQTLERFLLHGNLMTSINASMFTGLRNLQRINFNNNQLRYIEPGAFHNLSTVTDLVISSLSPEPYLLYPGIFDGLDSLTALYVYDQRLCCLLPTYVLCVVQKPAHPLFTCRKTFLQNTTIKVFIWILGLSALFGNIFVITLRIRSRSVTTVGKIQSMFITNLAVSDFFMGIYMVLIAVMDIYIGESYFWEGRADEWRSSVTCQIAGFLSVLSSEASVFLLTLITADRFISIVFPFSQHRLSTTSARLALIVIWIVAISLSLIGVLLNNVIPDAYGLSDVCVGLPFIRKSTDISTVIDQRSSAQYNTVIYNVASGSTVSTWQFSIFLFLGVNLFSFISILFSYIIIFIKIRLDQAEVGRRAEASNEIKMALKMFLIVGTDFCCWMPIIILGILVQTVGVDVTPDIYAWLVVFVLPINSSLNPYLYTIIHMSSKRSSNEKSKQTIISMVTRD
ncbi:G-protein coupled receptor GRL101-like [Lytechinus variegatus]|uniref:G-protein coupled receptor GRL101-like n=1 Tax=Lytechinus variegatus TaxID=7654 RepID=UPI001BB292A6|nr:G-protein coupled receptor GRL101-like [Lytechinus variegatus]